MAELACVYDAAPAPRTPADIITPPGQDKKDRARGPAAAGPSLPVRQLFQNILHILDQFRPLLDQTVGASA